jgi:PKD repeat protein
VKSTVALCAAFLFLVAGCVEPSQPAASTTPPVTSSATPAPTATDASPAPNQPPTATLNASTAAGTAPLTVTFELGGSDADGDALTWRMDAGDEALGDGSELPATVTHTFEAAGEHLVVLTVSDGTATSTANRTITVTAPKAQGLPVPDGTLVGSVFAYQSVAGAGVGVSNIVSLATGAAGDPVPKYPAGSDVQITSRSTRSTNADVKINAATPANFTLYRADGTVALGPLQATGSADGSNFQYTAGTVKLPSQAGFYFLDFALTVDDVEYHVKDDSTNSGGLRKIQIV